MALQSPHMQFKSAHSPKEQPFSNHYQLNQPKSMTNTNMYESARQPQNTAFRLTSNSPFTTNEFSNVKRLPEQAELMRHTMNLKTARRLGSYKWDEQANKPNKMDDFLRQTMSYKSSTRHTLNYQEDASSQIYMRPNNSQSTLHYNHLLSADNTSSIKSQRQNEQGSRNLKKYQRLSQQIDRNKKLIEALKKTAEYDHGYLKNVNHNKQPSYIDLDKQKQPNQQGFKKNKRLQHNFLTPQNNKDFGQLGMKSSPKIQAPKSAQQKLPESEHQTAIQSHRKKPSFVSNFKTKSNSPLDDFQQGKRLGEGKFGTVNIVRSKKTGGVFALKKIPKAMIKSHMMVDQLSLQVKIQSCLNHPSILGMHGFFDDKTHFYIVLEYMDGGTLYEKMKKVSKLSEKQTALIIKQMAEAIEYLHDMGIAHRDLKPQNIVISNNVYKLCDFGWAAICDERRKTYCGTFDYVAPQILQGVDYDITVDLWCLGVMTFELMTGKAPFYHISRKQTMKKILNVQNQNLVFPEGMSETARDFIERLVRKNPNERIKASQALLHPFLRDVGLNE